MKKNIPAAYPDVVFTLGEKLYRLSGAPDVSKTKRVDTCITENEVTGLFDGIRVTLSHTGYTDFGANEWTAFFTNESQKRSGVLCGAHLEFVFEKNTDRLTYYNGDNGNETGYERFETTLDEPFEMHPAGGVSCSGASPYMRLSGIDGGVNLAVGWTGMWYTEFSRENGTVKISVGQKRCRMYLEPGETIRTPMLCTLPYSGDEGRGRNAWRNYYFTHICPKSTDGDTLPPLLCLHVLNACGKPEFTGADEQNQLDGISDYVNKNLRPDVWWIDAGWYPCDYEWTTTGTWEPDPMRFPNGLTPIGDRCRKENIKFLLWFEPERVRADTWLYENRPEWVLSLGNDDPNMLLDLGNGDCLKWLIDHVDGLIKRSGVSVYRQDFNFSPLPIWEKNEAPDRIGAMENHHIQGYYKYWDELLLRNPGLFIDSCASGGRRNDYETIKRAVPLHYTDVQYGVHPVKQKQHRFMFEWIPYFRAHNMSWDDTDGSYYTDKAGSAPQNDEFSYQCAMAPSMTCMLCHDADESGFKTARKMTALWRRAAALMLSTEYYPLSVCRRSEKDFYAMEFYDRKEKRGFFQVLANTKADSGSFTVRLTLDMSCEYTLEDGQTGKKVLISGKTLAEGYEVKLPARSGRIFFFTASK